MQQEDPAFYWLAMARIRGVGTRTWLHLLRSFKSAEAIFTAENASLADHGLNDDSIQSLKNPDWNLIDSDLVWLADPCNHLLTWNDRRYPTLLRQIHDPPPVLYVRGDPGVLDQLQISIVGSRNPSADGRRNAREFARNLCGYGLTITSGLATGLDTCAHLGALDVSGRTIAVFGSGLDVIYPAGNQSLAENLVRSGALVSEYPPGTRPLPVHFPKRNRIISGLSVGTLVVEATLSSGSLITAGCALEQGREVFAIPGSIHNPLSRGCHRIIRDGAKLVESVDDILVEIIPSLAVTNQAGHEPAKNDKNLERLDGNTKLLLDNIGLQPVGVDILVSETGMEAGRVTATLLVLELDGLIEQVPGGEYVRSNG